MVSPGAYLTVGQQITEVAAIDEMKITFSAPERYLAQLQRGAAVQITTTAYPDDVFDGAISVVDPLIDPVSHTVQLEARIPNRARKLRPGMSADVTVNLGVRPQALTVPDEAVFGEGDQNFVYVVKPDSTVSRQPVVLGTRDSTRAEIVSGVKAGDRVVQAGYQKLYEGAHVMPVAAGGPEAGAAGGGARASLRRAARRRDPSEAVDETQRSLGPAPGVRGRAQPGHSALRGHFAAAAAGARVSGRRVTGGQRHHLLSRREPADGRNRNHRRAGGAARDHRGVKLITSSSREQGSVITVEFQLSRNVDEAANDVRDRVSRVRGSLPSTVDDPIVAKQDVNAQPIIWLSLNGQRFSMLELSEAANNILTEKIQRLDGVGAVFVGAERKYAMRVWLDPLRLASYGLTVADAEQALRAGNAEIPSGRVEGHGREFSVRTRGDLSTPEEFAAIVVAQHGDRPIRLGDVADVRVGAEDDRTVARYNTVPSIGLGIVKQQKASTVDVAHKIHDALPRLRELLPPGMNLEVAYDSSTFIEDSIHEVLVSLGVAFLLVVLVIFVFLGSLRATLIPVVAIPVSLIGTFTVVYFLGFTINILTLLAMVLAIGLVVDDAIIMLENIYRHMEMGRARLRATIDGSKEIGFAILATTIALVAVFVPVAFLTGRVGRLFNEFGIAVAVSVLISGFVALSLTPMLCSLLLKRAAGAHMHEADELDAVADAPASSAEVEERAPRWRIAFNQFFHGLHVGYERILRGALAHRLAVMIAAVAIVLSIGVLFFLLPQELVPTEDRGMVFNVVLAPEGATLDYTDRYMRQVEAIYQRTPEVAAFFSAVGLGFGGPGRVTDGFMFVRLKPYDQRKFTQQQIVGMLFPQLLGIPGVLAIPINLPSLGGGFGSPVQFVLRPTPTRPCSSRWGRS